MTDYDNPFADEIDTDDPFATSDDVRTTFTPSPTLEALNNRFVAMIPRSFRDDAPIPADWQQPGGPTVRDQFTIDLAVFDGQPLTYWYNDKDQQGTVTVKEITVDTPVMFTGVWIVQGALVGQLKKVDGTRRPILLGQVRRGPQAKDRKAGRTFADIEQAYVAWEQAGKRGPEPKFSWQVDVDAATPEVREQAKAWFRTSGITL